MAPINRLVRCVLAALGSCVVLALACYEVPQVRDYYACQQDAECGDGGFVCDDGVCCREREAPFCTGRVLDGGTCLDGGRPMTYYEDLDEDGFGNLARPLYRCSPPQSVPTVTNGDDCNDKVTAGGWLFFPGAPEQCDSYDNDCDGMSDEGLGGSLYYLDQDNDGFGDPERAGTFCQQPVGWVENRKDCGPDSGNVHPGAIEFCNGLDDDCNGPVDDTAQLGEACVVPGRSGVCAEGVRACPGGKDVCQQLNAPAALDTCNGKDDDCDGTADEKPDCGGPVRFSADPSVVFGARHLDQALNGVTSECLKTSSTFPNATPADVVTGDVWTGSGANSHVFWAERDGGTWDFSRASTTLRLSADVSSDAGTGTNPDGGVNSWSQHRQPVVLLCGPGGFLRLVSTSPLLDSTGAEYIRHTIALPPDGGAWIVGAHSSPDVQGVLRQVKRVEVLIQPASSTGSFKVDFQSDFGLP